MSQRWKQRHRLGWRGSMVLGALLGLAINGVLFGGAYLLIGPPQPPEPPAPVIIWRDTNLVERVKVSPNGKRVVLIGAWECLTNPQVQMIACNDREGEK